MNNITQYEKIGNLLLNAYPSGSICSQSVARDIALQLPRVINHLRHLPQFKVDDYQTKYGQNIVSLHCSHSGTNLARDYKLTIQGYDRLKKVVNKLQRDRGVLPADAPMQPAQSWEHQKPIPYTRVVNGVKRTFYRYPTEAKQEELGI